MEPLGGNRLHFADLREWDKNHKIFTDLRETLEAVGVDITFLQPEYPPGQWEVSTAPQSGLRGGDVGFHVKHAVKGFFSTRGYLATFMTRPTLESISSGLHLNHSLWKRVGSDKEGSDSNVLLDSSADDKLSDTARHWIAGLATHAPALSAICSPTLNCYRRLHNMCAPSHGTWGHDDRNAMIRARTSRDNVFLENRLVSAAASPYLALAATVAAGMDGLNRLLQCPPPMHKDRAPEVPRTLSEALDALDKDVEMRALLGDYFVDCYVGAKRECEVKAFNDAALTTEAEEMEFERKMYMEAL
nr:hypothetical protein BaRGS_009010 [Batillaria attramentaria]